MSKWDKYKVGSNSNNLSKWDKYKVVDEPDVPSKWDKYKVVEPKKEQGIHGNIVDSWGVEDIGDTLNFWNRRGDNVAKKLSFYDKHLIDNKPHYFKHRPTWKDRAKEVGQGLAGFSGGMVDLGNDVADLIGVPKREVTGDYRTKWKNAKPLRTKNIDTTSYVLRAMGEFVPEILPMAGIGVGAKAIGSAIAKGAKHINLPIKTLSKYGNKVANFLKTPINKKNIAGFAGAGAAHGALHTPDFDGKEKDIPWYTELPAVVAGASLGSGVVKGGSKIHKFINKKKPIIDLSKQPKQLSTVQKLLAKHIDKNSDKLDEKFIDLANKGNIDLNALNIYESPDNKAFLLAYKFPNEKYEKILPKMKDKIFENSKKVLDEEIVPFDSSLNPDELSNLVAKEINNVYANRLKQTRTNFENAYAKSHPSDKVGNRHSLSAVANLYEETKGIPGAKNSDLGNLHELAKEMLHTNLEVAPTGLIPLRKITASRTAVNDHLKKTYDNPYTTGRQKMRLNDIKKGIDIDIEEAIKNGGIKDPIFLNMYKNARQYHKDKIGSYKRNHIFRGVGNIEKNELNPNAGDIIKSSLKNKGDYIELEKLLQNAELDKGSHINNAKENLKKLTRSKLEQRYFDKDNIKIEKLLQNIKDNKHNPLYDSVLFENNKNVPLRMHDEINPTINKYKALKKISDDYPIHIPQDSDLTSADTFRAMLGAGAGAMYTPSPSSAVLGGALLSIPPYIWGKVRSKLSESLYKNTTDKQFVDELINLKRNPKQKEIKSSRPILNNLFRPSQTKLHGVRSLNRKNEGEKWGE